MLENLRANGMPLRRLGWAFLLAWVFCVFYTNATGAVSTQVWQEGMALGSALYYAAFPLATSVTTLIVIVVAEPHFGAPTNHRALRAAAPFLTAASTPLLFIVPTDPAANAVLFGVGSIMTGVGSALLWVMWGEYYAVIPREKSELLAPISSVSAAVLVLLVSAMEGWVAIAAATVLPLLSGLCLHLVWTDNADKTERRLAQTARTSGKTDARHLLAGLGRTGCGILVVFAVVSIAGMNRADYVEGLALQTILVFSALMMALVAAMAVSGPRRISMFFLYRWICPTLVIGLAAVILLGNDGNIAAAAASLGGRFTFCLIAQIYFANYAAAGRATPAQSSSLGWLFVHAGDLLGVVIWTVLGPWITTSPEGILWVSTISIVVLVVVTMMVMGETSAFLQVPEQNPVEPAVHGAAESASTVDGANAHTADSIGAGIEIASVVELGPNPNSESATETDPEARIAALAAEHRLTPRETEVFALLSQGRSIPYIRDELVISRETAATHAKHIYAKLGVHSRQELIDLVQR